MTKQILLLLAGTALAQSPPPGFQVQKGILATMRDGTRLAADIYLPTKGGPRFPVLIARTPYNKDGERRRAEFFARHGYVFLSQDCRGFGDSPGRFDPFVHEGADGYDTIEWAARQPWSNGRIGTLGASYLALVQYAALIENPPHLSAVYAAVGPTDYYHQGAWRGGAPSSGSPIWVLNAAASRAGSVEARKRIEAVVREPREWLLQPLAERLSLLDGLPEYSDLIRQYARHAEFDGFWKSPGYWPAGYLRKMKDVPMLLVSGWYDSFAEATIDLHRDLSAMQRSPKSLIVGPWPHAYGKRQCGEAVFPLAAELDVNKLQLAWFDHWLKDESRPDLPAIRYFVMGGGPGMREEGFLPGGEWRESGAWPPAGAVSQTMYLWPDGGLGPAVPKEGTVSFAFDPKDPVPVRGGRFRNGCIVDLDAAQPRAGVISFRTAPLDAPVVLAGPIRLDLNVATTAGDADFVVRLVDVWPNGYAMPVAEGAIRLGRRTADGRRSAVTPGKRYLISIELGSSAIRTAAGHRLRVDISSAAFPAIEANASPAPARQSIFTGGVKPSSLTITVAPKSPG